MNFAFSLLRRSPRLGLGFSPLLRGAGAVVGAPHTPSHLISATSGPAAATPRSGARVVAGGGEGRGWDEGPESVAWHSKSKELPLAQIGAGAACGLSRATSAGIFSAHRWPGRSPGAPDPARPKCFNFPGVQRRRPAARTGGGKVPPASLRFLCGHLPRRRRHRHLLPRAARTPSFPLAQPKFPAPGCLVPSGATKRGTPGPGRLRRWLSRLRVFEVGPLK